MRFNLIHTSRFLAAAGLLMVPSSVFADPAGYTVVSDGGAVYSQPGYCPECEAGVAHDHGHWLHGDGEHEYHSPFHVWLHQNGSRTHSPDHGYRRPTKLPIVTFPVQYYRYWPERWYGMPGSQLPSNPNYPMVYMPTDTTQLGYYYQRVPTWQPNPGMLPYAPFPPNWHRYEQLTARPRMDGYCPPGAVPMTATVESTGTPTPIASPTLAEPAAPIAPSAPAPEAAPTPESIDSYEADPVPADIN